MKIIFAWVFVSRKSSHTSSSIRQDVVCRLMISKFAHTRNFRIRPSAFRAMNLRIHTSATANENSVTSTGAVL